MLEENFRKLSGNLSDKLREAIQEGDQSAPEMEERLIMGRDGICHKRMMKKDGL